MKKYAYVLTVILFPVVAGAGPVRHLSEFDIPEINIIRGEIRDDYRQLEEDRESGDIIAIRADERDIAEDKLRLRDAYQRHNLKYTPDSWRKRDRARERASLGEATY